MWCLDDDDNCYDNNFDCTIMNCTNKYVYTVRAISTDSLVYFIVLQRCIFKITNIIIYRSSDPPNENKLLFYFLQVHF